MNSSNICTFLRNCSVLLRKINNTSRLFETYEFAYKLVFIDKTIKVLLNICKISPFIKLILFCVAHSSNDRIGPNRNSIDHTISFGMKNLKGITNSQHFLSVKVKLTLKEYKGFKIGVRNRKWKSQVMQELQCSQWEGVNGED